MKSEILLMILGLGLSLELTAGSILASKEGPFEKFNLCTVEDGHSTISIGFNSGHKLIERSSLYLSTQELKDLSLPAIAGIGRQFFRWFPTQTDYNVRGADGSLVTYFSEGLKNINNDSHAALELRTQVDKICDQVTDFRILGEFQVDLKIGRKVFADKLVVKRTNGSFRNAQIEGSYLVPDSFESKIKDLKYTDGDFTFIIHVKEGTQEYDAIFEGKLNRKDELSGNAFVLPERKLLGSFTGRRL